MIENKRFCVIFFNIITYYQNENACNLYVYIFIYNYVKMNIKIFKTES